MKINPLMYFELRDGSLVTYHKEKDNYRIETSQYKNNITKDNFLYLTPVQISKRKFYEKLNLFYSTVKDKWAFGGCFYRNLPNYTAWGDLRTLYQPNHEIKGVGMCKLVYHHGRLMYAYQFNFDKVMLFNHRTHEFESRTSIRNCAPIQNMSTNKII